MNEQQHTMTIINPATEEIFATCPDYTQAQLNQAIEVAEQAFVYWKGHETHRRQLLAQCAGMLKTNVRELALLLTTEQGKPFKEAINEIIGAAWWIEQVLQLQIPHDILKDDESERIEVLRKPLGVVAAITPWNYPVMLAIWKIAPALLTGNTLILKPSPYTPLTVLKIGHIFNEVLPPGVLNVISGGHEVGAWLTQHPAVRKVTFTGSTATGKKVAAAAASDLKRLSLELGGNDPAIVLADIDPQKVAVKLFWNAFENCGQTCYAIKRIYVHEKIYKPLLDELVTLAQFVRIGGGLEPLVQLGPLNNKPQLQRIEALVEEARSAGAAILCGGKRLERQGYFYPPTIVTDLSEDSRLVSEEQFGPALPVMPFSDVEDALIRANASHYGLGGSVWTNDLQRGAELAAHLECGTAWVNQVKLHPHVPFGGVKWSGLMRENGIWGLEAYTELQTLHISKPVSERSN